MKLSSESLSDATMAAVERHVDAIRPRVLPADWACMQSYINASWYKSRDGLAVCVEVEAHDGDTFWLHVSMSRRDKDPSYFDMKRVKDLFIGRERKAIQVFPSEAEHYNFHPHCLHLWSPLSADPLPDLRTASGEL